MTPAPRQPDPNDRDPLGAYADGDRDAVRAARPDEPNAAQWDAVCRNIHARLNPARAPEPGPRGRWRVAVLVATGAALTAVAASIAWVALAPAPVAKPEVAETRSAPAPEAPDPLAEFAVLPMATDNEVELRRVPGSGWFPVGADPLPDVLSLATVQEVELEDPDPAWPHITQSPGDAPMIFAAKLR